MIMVISIKLDVFIDVLECQRILFGHALGLWVKLHIPQMRKSAARLMVQLGFILPIVRKRTDGFQ